METPQHHLETAPQSAIADESNGSLKPCRVHTSTKACTEACCMLLWWTTAAQNSGHLLFGTLCSLRMRRMCTGISFPEQPDPLSAMVLCTAAACSSGFNEP